MKTLSDLTLSQLTAVYSAVSGTPVKAKFFNSRQTGRRRVEALLSEKGLTLADALLAAGFTTETAPVAEETKAEAPEIEADTDVSEPELTSPAWDEVQPEIEIDAKLDAAPEDVAGGSPVCGRAQPPSPPPPATAARRCPRRPGRAGAAEGAADSGADPR